MIGTRADFPTRRLAERQFETLLARINAPSYRPGRIASLAEFADRWQREVLIHHKPSSIKAANSHLRCHILPLLGKTKLEELGLEVQQGFITRLAEAVARKTAINVMGTLSVMLSTAKNWGYICEPVEFGKLTMPMQEVKEDARFFTAEEAKQIISTAEEPFRTMFAIAAMTGVRAGEFKNFKKLWIQGRWNGCTQRLAVRRMRLNQHSRNQRASQYWCSHQIAINSSG